MNAPFAPHPCGILVVDDDARLAATLQELLVGEGYAVEVAQSGAEALAIHERNPGIAVALIDLIMPVTDGLALLDELHRRDPDLAVVVMTGYGTIETAVEAIKPGHGRLSHQADGLPRAAQEGGAAPRDLRAAGARATAGSQSRSLPLVRDDRLRFAGHAARH